MDSPNVAPPARRFPLSSALPFGFAALLILAVGGPASAQLPPVDKTVDQVDQTVDQTVDQVQETVDDTVDTTTEVTEVDTTTAVVGDASETVEETGQEVTGAAGAGAEDVKGTTSVDQGSGAGTAPSGAEAAGARRMTGSGKNSTGDRDEAGTASSGRMMTPAREMMAAPALLSGGAGAASSGVRPGSGNRGSTPPFFEAIPEGEQIMLLAALAALLSLIGLVKLGARFYPRPASGPRLFLPPLDQ